MKSHLIEYKALIKRARKRKPEDLEYGENHHIRPKSMGGRADHTVFLSLKEHLEAHRLLMHITFGTKHHIKMVWAYMNMANTRDLSEVDPADYERARILFIKNQTGKNNPMKRPEVRKKNQKAREGYKHSKKTRKKISASNKGRKCSEETKRKISEAVKGKKRSEESKRKMSKAKKGNKSHLGKKHTEKTKRKISKILKNLPKLTCPRCGKTMDINHYKGYKHGKNCKGKK